MEKMKDLRDLLVHEIEDLYSAETQIIEAMPAMIEKAKDPTLIKSLKDHLKVTEKQKVRLDQVKQLMGEENGDSQKGEKKGIISRMFNGGGHKCRGMEGLIEEGEKVMGEDMSPEVLDAAIIASAQKIEHYEICGYGTARAYARELNLGKVAELLEETLNEEYQADDALTDLAVGKVNEEAEIGDRLSVKGRKSGARNNGSSAKSSRTTSNSKSNTSASAKSSGKKSSTPAKTSRSLRTNKKTTSKAQGKTTSNRSGKSKGK